MFVVSLWGARGHEVVGRLVWLVEKRESWRRWRGWGLGEGVRFVGGGESGILVFFGVVLLRLLLVLVMLVDDDTCYTGEPRVTNI
jgi:hypothetical protein